MKIQKASAIIIFALAFLNPSSSLSVLSQQKTAHRQLKPERVAQTFYQAWQQKNRKIARQVAAKEAIDKLFSVKWRAMKFNGCERKEERGWQCVYEERGDDFSLAMEVDGGVSAGGYNVTAVSFSSEAALKHTRPDKYQEVKERMVANISGGDNVKLNLADNSSRSD